MADVFRFINASDTTLLDLNTSDTDSAPGWRVHRGLDIGTPQMERTYLSQPPYSGSVLATSRLAVVTMKVPVFIWPQDETTNALGDSAVEKLKTLMEAMWTELQKDHNILEYQPDGYNTEGLGSYYFNTYRSTMSGLMRGMDIPSPYVMKHSGVPLILEIDREPDIRYGTTYGASTISNFHF